MKRIEQATYRWKVAYKKDGIIGLEDTRKMASAKPRSTQLTKEEIIERQNTKIKSLEAHVELLKKIRRERKSGVSKK